MRTSRCLIVLATLLLSAASAFAADLSGSWTGQFASDMNPANIHKFVLDLNVDGTRVTGTMGFCKADCTNPMGNVALEDGKVDGNTISFGIETDAKDVPHIDFQGTVSGGSINFIVSGKAPDCGGAECQIGQGSATRTTSALTHAKANEKSLCSRRRSPAPHRLSRFGRLNRVAHKGLRL